MCFQVASVVRKDVRAEVQLVGSHLAALDLNNYDREY